LYLKIYEEKSQEEHVKEKNLKKDVDIGPLDPREGRKFEKRYRHWSLGSQRRVLGDDSSCHCEPNQ
jgi:hypothetical protein